MQRHWLVTLQNLSAMGRNWDADVPKALLQDELSGSVNMLPGLLEDIHWQLSLQRKGKMFYSSGNWQTGLARSCSRCNADFAWSVRGSTERVFQLGLPVADDDHHTLDCEYIDKPGEVNLLDVLREDIWLAWSADVICSDSCKGLCQGCGVNLNIDPCQCKQDDSGNPFAALRNLNLG